MIHDIGVGLVVAGIIVMLVGDVCVKEGKGSFARMIQWPKGRAGQLKVLLGLALLYAGIMLLGTPSM